MSTTQSKKKPPTVKVVAKKKVPVKKVSKPRSNRVEKDLYVDFRGPEDVASEQMELLSDENAMLKEKLAQTTDKYEAVKERLSELNKTPDRPAEIHAYPDEVSKEPLSLLAIESFDRQLKTTEDFVYSIESRVNQLFQFPKTEGVKGAPQSPVREDFFYLIESRIEILANLNNRLNHIFSHIQKII